MNERLQYRKERRVRGKWLWTVIIMIGGASCAIAGGFFQEQTVTLNPPHDKVTGKYYEGRACFSFRQGLRKDASNGGDWDLGYGFAAINNEDWFILHGSTESRTVIRDLGELNWTDSFEAPTLEPLPFLPKGERRSVTIDTSADTGKLWAKSINIMAKVVSGHMYLNWNQH